MRTVEFKAEVWVSIDVEDDEMTNEEIIQSLEDGVYVADLLHIGDPIVQEGDVMQSILLKSDSLIREDDDIVWQYNK
jgi:hypothetical protein